MENETPLGPPRTAGSSAKPGCRPSLVWGRARPFRIFMTPIVPAPTVVTAGSKHNLTPNCHMTCLLPTSGVRCALKPLLRLSPCHNFILSN